MSCYVNIKVENKIARLIDDIIIVCGNSDYTIKFDFDEEWNEYAVKTARFITALGYQDVVFEGDCVNIPVLKNTAFVRIGVFAGDLHTTTPAEIFCKRSILCEDGAPQDPGEAVYNQIIEMINAGMLQGEQGEKGEKGDKGDAGAIKFIPVAELPTENIDESAIYLVPLATEDEQNRFTEYVYIDGKWEVIGAITVQVDHSEYVKFTDYATTDKAGVIKVNSTKYGFGVVDDGYLYLYGASNPEVERRLAGRVVKLDYLDHAVYCALTGKHRKSNTSDPYYEHTITLTDEEKTSACGWLGCIPIIQFEKGRNRIYICKPNGELQVVEIAAAGAIPSGYAIPIGTSAGNIAVATPTADTHATNKQYVDDLIAELRAEIAVLKGE